MAKKTGTGKHRRKLKVAKKSGLIGKENRTQDIVTLLDSIRLEWPELSKTIEDVHKIKALMKHLEWCEEELSELQRKAEDMRNGG